MINSQIIKLLHWSQMEYAEFQYHTGLDYLQAYIPGDKHGIDMLVRNKMYWNWWKNHWQIRDSQFLETVDEYASVTDVVRIYKVFHKPEFLINEIFPNARIMQQDYARMIGKLQDAK